MKYLIAILTLLTWLLPSTLHAQNDALLNEVKQHITIDEIILKSRDLLIIKVIEGDNNKVQQLVNLLDNIGDSLNNLETLSPYERTLINLSLGNFYLISTDSTFIQWDPKLSRYQNNAIDHRIRNYDLLSVKLRDHLLKEKNSIQTRITSDPTLVPEEKDFLNLLTFTLLTDRDQNFTEEANRRADQFLFKYRHSKYNHYVRRYIVERYETSNWRFHYDVGFGFHGSTDSLGTLFKNGFALGFGAGTAYKNVVFNLKVHLGISSPTEDFRKNDTIWEKDHSSNITQFETSLGYLFAANKKISILPSVGIGTTSIVPSQGNLSDQERYDDVKFRAKLTYFVGLGINYKIVTNENSFSESATYLQLHYRYSMPQFEQSFNGLDGDVHMITLGVGGFFRGKKRTL